MVSFSSKIWHTRFASTCQGDACQSEDRCQTLCRGPVAGKQQRQVAGSPQARKAAPFLGQPGFTHALQVCFFVSAWTMSQWMEDSCLSNIRPFGGRTEEHKKIVCTCLFPSWYMLHWAVSHGQGIVGLWPHTVLSAQTAYYDRYDTRSLKPIGNTVPALSKDELRKP